MKKKNINNTDKKYEYDYGNKTRCIFSHLLGYWYNFAHVTGLNLTMWAILFCVINYINTEAPDFFTPIPAFIMHIFLSIFILITVASFIYIIVSAFLHKCVTLKNAEIVIIKTSINPNFFTRGQIEKIPYYLIKTCEYDEAWKAKISFYDYSVVFFNWESIAKITTISNKEYYIPLKEVDDFIAEVNERRKRFQINSDNSTENKDDI